MDDITVGCNEDVLNGFIAHAFLSPLEKLYSTVQLYSWMLLADLSPAEGINRVCDLPNVVF